MQTPDSIRLYPMSTLHFPQKSHIDFIYYLGKSSSSSPSFLPSHSLKYLPYLTCVLWSEFFSPSGFSSGSLYSNSIKNFFICNSIRPFNLQHSLKATFHRTKQDFIYMLVLMYGTDYSGSNFCSECGLNSGLKLLK